MMAGATHGDRDEGAAMTTDHDWPAWATDLFATITANIEFKGIGTLQGAYYAADDRDEPDLIEIAPALAELAVAGPNDGATVWSIIHSVDLLAIQQAFDQVDAIGMLLDNDDGSPELSVAGQLPGRPVLVTIYTKPFGDAEVDSIIRG
jgi:hypothetical protein